MNIQETITHLQSSIKLRANEIAKTEENRANWKESAKLRTASNDDYALYDWHHYHWFKDKANTLSKQQKIEKSLYKLMQKINISCPNGLISLYQIREM